MQLAQGHNYTLLLCYLHLVAASCSYYILLSLSTQDGLDPLQLAMVVVYIFICHQLTQILHLHALMVAIMQNVLVALFSMYECAQQAEVVLAHVVFVL